MALFQNCAHLWFSILLPVLTRHQAWPECRLGTLESASIPKVCFFLMFPLMLEVLLLLLEFIPLQGQLWPWTFLNWALGQSYFSCWVGICFPLINMQHPSDHRVPSWICLNSRGLLFECLYQHLHLSSKRERAYEFQREASDYRRPGQFVASYRKCQRTPLVLGRSTHSTPQPWLLKS